MEETKLLCILMLICFSVTVNTTLAKEADHYWVEGIPEGNGRMVIENFKNNMLDKDFDQDLRESILRPRPTLQIFVSSSMSKQSLKAYAREAHHYNGVLVFRGLPQGSFGKITDLVMSISDVEHPVSIQIDDEAFTQFDVKIVPAIVLAIPATIFSEQTTKEKFDKVTGHITIKAALEMFVQQGDLSTDAKERLK